MRFPRHAKIFRGQIDPAASAGLFFIFAFFLMLYGSHTFIPGVRVRLEETPESPEITARLLKIKKTGEVLYLGHPYTEAQFTARFREQAKLGTLPRRLIFDHEPGADEQMVARLEHLGLELNVPFRPPGNRLELPEFAGFPGATNPIVVVSINLNGQLFFQHQVVREDSLQNKLILFVENARFPVTMVVQADREVKYDKIIQVCAIARKAGIHEVDLATLPAPFE